MNILMQRGRLFVQLMNNIKKNLSTVNLPTETFLEPFTYMVKTLGTGSHAKLVQAYNVWLGISQPKLNEIIDIVQMIQQASNLVDDVQDNSQLRHGLPTAHEIYGVTRTINAANYIYFHIIQKLLNLKHSNVIDICIEQALAIHKGQGTELYWKENCICPTEQQYKEMIMLKNSAAYVIPLRLMQLFSTNSHNFQPFINAVGLYFQIQDDYCDLYNRDDASINDDITAGLYTLPIIHAIQTSDQDNQIKNILRQRTRNPNLKRHFISLLESYGSFEYTRNILVSLEQETRHEAKKLGENPIMDNILDELLIWKNM